VDICVAEERGRAIQAKLDKDNEEASKVINNLLKGNK
jgi:hypothetical protein